MKSSSFKALLGVTVCNLIWSAHPIFGKWLLEEYTPAQAAWLRYSSAGIGYLGIAVGIRYFSKERFPKQPFFTWPRVGIDRILVILLGFLTFCFSPLIQMTGLASSLASENAIIIAMEPLMTGFLAWAILRERITAVNLSAFILALVGFGFLSGLTSSDLSFRLGNFLILVSLLGEASYTILARRLTRSYPPLGLFGSALASGVLCLTVFSVVGFHSFEFPALTQMTWRTLLALIWMGPVGTAGAYLYYMYALVDLPVMSITLFLFLQPLAGSIWGYFLLGDRLTPLQNLGSSLILMAVVLPNALQLKKRAFQSN